MLFVAVLEIPQSGITHVCQKMTGKRTLNHQYDYINHEMQGIRSMLFFVLDHGHMHLPTEYIKSQNTPQAYFFLTFLFINLPDFNNTKNVYIRCCVLTRQHWAGKTEL